MDGEWLRRRAGRALVLAAGLVAGGAASSQGTLERVGEAVRAGAGDDGDEHHGDSHWSVDDHGLVLEDPLDTLCDWGLAPFLLPRTLLGDRGESGRFAEYPYRDGPGYWRFADPAALERQREWSLRPRAELGHDFDDLERFGLGLEVEHASRFGLDASWSRWREDLGGAATDELDLADLNLVYRFAQGPSTAFRAGLGLNVLDDERDSELGFNSTYGVEFFPVRPLFAALELDLGTLGDATQTHLRAELGLVLARSGLFASFDHLDIDGVELHGYALGLRAWM